MTTSLPKTKTTRQCASKYAKAKPHKTPLSETKLSKLAKSPNTPQKSTSLQYSDLMLEQDNDFAAKLYSQSPIISPSIDRKSTIGSEGDSKSWFQELEIRYSPSTFSWSSNDLLFERSVSISINIEELKAFGSPQMRSLDQCGQDEESIVEEDEEFGENIEIVLTNDENLSEKEELDWTERAAEEVPEQQEEDIEYRGDYEEAQHNDNICQEIEQVIQHSVEEPFLIRGFSFLKSNTKVLGEPDASLYNFNTHPNFGFFEDTIYRSDGFEDIEPKRFAFDEDLDLDMEDRVVKKIKTDWNSY